MSNELMITKQKAWAISRSGGAEKLIPRKRYLSVSVTDTKTGVVVYFKCGRDADRAHGWCKGYTAEAAKKNGIIAKRYQVRYAEEP